MTSKERVYRTLDFNQPDKIPVDIWPLPVAYSHFGQVMTDMIEERDVDILQIPFFNPVKFKEEHMIGVHTDPWGVVWHKLQAGIAGEPKVGPLEDMEADEIRKYVSPVHLLREHRQEMIASAEEWAAQHQDKFLLSGWMGIFERMQYLRGVENLYCDIALESEEFFAVRDIAFEYAAEFFEIMSSVKGADGCILGDDWGAQNSMLINPEAWRKLFKPCYQKLIDIIRGNGKRVFVHSDGNILPIYDDWIEMGVSAINSQVWCMGVPQVAAVTRHRITHWGELDRQWALHSATPEQLQAQIDEMKQYFWNGGGLIGQFEVNKDVPVENIRQGLFGW